MAVVWARSGIRQSCGSGHLECPVEFQPDVDEVTRRDGAKRIAYH
jgi:hypothetical protein